MKAHLAVGLYSGPQLTREVPPVPIALASPDLDPDGVQLEVPGLEGLDLPLPAWGHLEHKWRQRSEYLPGWKVLLQEFLQANEL